ncbi:hypothetical protein B5V91_10760 [Heyndrickxia sporothermodurans]|nr:hypothetical protein B5V91_10760 [Heyndrickxia sporothermodurans]PTY87147.1 hypothetical protein B5V90_11130 [Heyndrickxia sporothermodurans]
MPIFTFFESIAGIFPTISAIFYAISKLGGISPLIKLTLASTELGGFEKKEGIEIKTLLDHKIH